ncbi:unnamed protein product, partial [marine sediment metagenome]
MNIQGKKQLNDSLSKTNKLKANKLSDSLNNVNNINKKEGKTGGDLNKSTTSNLNNLSFILNNTFNNYNIKEQEEVIFNIDNNIRLQMKNQYFEIFDFMEKSGLGVYTENMLQSNIITIEDLLGNDIYIYIHIYICLLLPKYYVFIFIIAQNDDDLKVLIPKEGHKIKLKQRLNEIRNRRKMINEGGIDKLFPDENEKIDQQFHRIEDNNNNENSKPVTKIEYEEIPFPDIKKSKKSHKRVSFAIDDIKSNSNNSNNN